MRKKITFKRYSACLVLTLFAMLHSLHLTAEPAIENVKVDVGEIKSDRQLRYEQLLDYAIGSFPIVGKTWPLNWAKEALKNNEPFDSTTADTLTMTVQNLAATGASRYQRELPQQYAVWKEVCTLMDQAEKAGLYTPPEKVNAYLIEWRRNQAIAAEIDAAPWVNGPAEVAIDPNMGLVYIPSGFRFLPREEHLALEKRLRLLRGPEKEEYLPIDYNHKFNSDWVMPIDSHAWSVTLNVYYGLQTATDTTLQSDEELLEKIKTRLTSTNEIDGSYANHAVRWIMPPKKNAEANTVRWAFTNGRVDEPIGIESSHLVLGSKMLLKVDYQDLSVAEYLSTAKKLIEGQDREDYKAENVFTRADAALKPFFDSLSVEVNDTFVDRDGVTRTNAASANYFITGVPSKAQQTASVPESDEEITESDIESNDEITEADDVKSESLIEKVGGILLLLLSAVILLFMLRPQHKKRLHSRR